MDFIKLLNGTERTYLREMAAKTIVRDLFDNNIRGLKRAHTLTFWEDEEAFARVGQFLPGCFYIFSHEGEFLYTSDAQKKFHDTVPIFLSLRVDVEPKTLKKYTFGINFNIIPSPIRAAILQELYNMDKTFFDTLTAEHVKGKHVYSKKIVAAFAADNGKKFCEYICRKYNINKNSIAFRKYYFENIKRCRMIDYWQWQYLPFLDIAEGVRGVELAKLQKEAINKK